MGGLNTCMMSCGQRVRTAISMAWKSLDETDFKRLLKLYKGMSYFVLLLICVGLIASKFRELFSNDIGTEIKIQFAHEHALPSVAFCRYGHKSKRKPGQTIPLQMLTPNNLNFFIQSLSHGAPWTPD